MNRLSRVAAAAALVGISVIAFSQGARPDPNKSAIDARQAVFKLIANQNGPIGAMFRPNGTFDAALAARNAERVKMLAEMIPELFARDTREYKEGNTKALDGIWTSPADFKAKADALVAAADGVMMAAKTGDKDATQKANAEIGKSCGGCHESFREKR